MFGDHLGYFEKHQFLSKTCEDTFLATFGKNWAAFNSNIWSLQFSEKYKLFLKCWRLAKQQRLKLIYFCSYQSYPEKNCRLKT